MCDIMFGHMLESASQPAARQADQRKEPLHWSHRSVNKTGNGTHTLQFKLCKKRPEGFFQIHTHFTHRTTVYAQITQKQNNTGKGGKMVWAQEEERDNFVPFITKSLHLTDEAAAASPCLG